MLTCLKQLRATLNRNNNWLIKRKEQGTGLLYVKGVLQKRYKVEQQFLLLLLHSLDNRQEICSLVPPFQNHKTSMLQIHANASIHPFNKRRQSGGTNSAVHPLLVYKFIYSFYNTVSCHLEAKTVQGNNCGYIIIKCIHTHMHAYNKIER